MAAKNSVLLNQVSHGETLENSAKHTTQNHPSQGTRELGYSYPTPIDPWLRAVPRGDIKAQVPPCSSNPRAAFPEMQCRPLVGRGGMREYNGVYVEQQGIC